MVQIYWLLLIHDLLALNFTTTYKREYIRKETSYRQTEIKVKPQRAHTFFPKFVEPGAL